MIDPELFEIRPLNYSNSAAFIFKHHYTKNMAQGASLALGLFYKKKYFVAVCVFSSPSSEKARAWPFGEEEKHRVIELHRLAMIKKDNWKSRPRNILSWFVSRCLKLIVQHKPDIRCIITFADSTEGHKGTIYRALNAFYFGLVGRRREVYKNKDNKIVSAKTNGKNVGRAEAKQKGLTRTKREKKYKYAWIVGPDRREVKTWTARLKHKRLLWIKEPKAGKENDDKAE